MADGPPLHLDVALDLSSDTIRGAIDDDAGPVVEFSGWLELMSAFETVCARADGGGRGAGSGAADARFGGRCGH